MKQTQAGFSLIELVIVVVILGLLAVTALPRFLDVTEEAQIANMEGMAGGFATGISLARAQWEAEGRPRVEGVNSVNYDGIRLYLTTASDTPLVSPGYPVGLSPEDSQVATMQLSDCADIWNGVMQNPASLTSVIADASANRYFVDTTSDGQCVYYLIQTLDRAQSGAISDPNGSTDVGHNFVYIAASGRVLLNIN